MLKRKDYRVKTMFCLYLAFLYAGDCRVQALALQSDSWTKHSIATTDDFHRGFFLNHASGWLVTHSTGLVLRTTDGGKSWLTQQKLMEFTRVDLKSLGHRDSGAVIEDYLLRNLADESSKPLLAYHQLMLEHIFHFFQAHLKQDAAALAFLKRSVIENRSRADGVSIQHREALPVPPNRGEITAILERDGAAGLQKLYQTLKVKDAQPFTESALRGVGIEYAFRRRNYDIATAVFNLMIEIYPQRCAAYFYAGVVYRNKKQADLAIRSFEKFFAVKPNDPFTSAEEKESLSVSAQEYLNGLKAR